MPKLHCHPSNVTPTLLHLQLRHLQLRHLQLRHYSTSSPYHCPPAAVLALKLSTTEDTTSPPPPLLMPQALYFPAPAPAGQPFCYSSTPALPHYSTNPPLSLPYTSPIPATATVPMCRP